MDELTCVYILGMVIGSMLNLLNVYSLIQSAIKTMSHLYAQPQIL